MTSPLTIKGLRKRDREELADLGDTVHDLLWRLPGRYQDRRRLTPIADITYKPDSDEKVMLLLTVSDMKRITTKRQQRTLWLITFSDGVDETTVTFFNPYINKVLQPGKRVFLWGKVQVGYKGVEISSANFEVLEGNDQYGLAPIYRGAAGIEPRRVRIIMHRLLDVIVKAGDLQDPVPLRVRQRRRLMPLSGALRMLHAPGKDDDERSLDMARRSLAYTEAWLLAAGLRLRRRGREEGDLPAGDPIVLTDEEHEQIVEALGHRPTPDQRRAINEIRRDLSAGRPMRRLLQGDVGSGKTMVSTYALLATAMRGHQAAMLAPTEILARQHNVALRRACAKLDIDNWILLGSTPQGQRATTYNAFGHGYGRILVGTHAIIEKKMQFRDLRTVVIDEQHKFGVMQRQKLINKAAVAPHVLSTTATPIPRTLTLAMHGDLDVSIIRTKPPGRGPTATRLIPADDWERLIDFCRMRVRAGDQIYFVCPAVAEGVRASQQEDAEELAAVEEVARRLQHSALADEAGGVVRLHGKLSTTDKDQAMKRFANGDTRVMVTSTVVEVGVDVPEATVMVILDADRFGLTQVHQLRGRVGRGARGGICLLVTRFGAKDAMKRLKTMCATADGFVVAEADLAIRGCGEWFAERQHGAPRLRVLDLNAQRRLLEDAFEDVDEMLAESSGDHTELKRQIVEHFGPDFRFTGHDSG